MKLTLKIVLLLFVISGCKTRFVLLPNYVSSVDLANLTIGSTKAQVKQTLGSVFPFDIMSGGGACEVHLYKYKTPAKLNTSYEEARAVGLTSGVQQYVDESDAVIVYKDGKLQSMITNIGKRDLDKLINDLTKINDICEEKGLRGCTDPMSLNYNPDAIVSDGACEYCPCEYIKNPNFNSMQPVSECNSKCISIANHDAGNGQVSCSNCEIIDKLTASKATINVNLNLDGDKADEKSKSSKFQLPKFNQAKKTSPGNKIEATDNSKLKMIPKPAKKN